MKKVLFLIFILAQFSIALSQWQNVGNAERITAYEKELKDFVITEDNKFIYTLGDTNIIKKWDYQTGELLRTDTIIPDPNYMRTANWLFLSSDGKSYCTGYYYSIQHPQGTFINQFIWDIETNVGIDSIRINDPLGTSYIWRAIDYYLIDYSFNGKIFLSSLNMDAIPNDGAGYKNGQKGKMYIIQKKDNNWDTLIDYEKNVDYLIKNNSNDGFYFSLYNSSSSDVPHHNYSSNFEKYYIYFSLDNNVKAILDNYQYSSYYSYSTYQSDKTEVGKNYTFHSGIFKKNKLFLVNGFDIHTINLDSVKEHKIYTIDDFFKKNHYLVNTMNDDYFFAFQDSEICIFDLQQFQKKVSLNLDGCGNINKFKPNYSDSTYMLSDRSRQLFKFKYTDIFKITANFRLSDSIAFTGDTIKFTNTSIINPTSYLWDFGDGSTSTEVNPYHIYQDSGYFNIKLIAIDKSGSDTVIKNNILYVMQNPSPDFEYELSGSIPVEVKFKHLIKSNFDSLVWDFGDNTKSKTIEPTKKYYYSDSYPVNLKVYKFGVMSEITKLVRIDVIEPQLPKRFHYEFADTNRKDAIAIKGWEDYDNYLVYHILEGNEYRHGAYKSFAENWNVKGTPVKEFFVKKSFDNYFFFLDSNIIIKSKTGNIKETKKYINSSLIYSLKSNNNYITCNWYKLVPFSMDIISDNAEKIFEQKIKYYIPYGINITKLNQYFAEFNEDKYDYCLSFFVSGTNHSNGRPYEADVLLINEAQYNKRFQLRDFIRLNNSLLTIIDNETIINYNSTGFRKSDDYKTSLTKELSSIKFSPWSFKGLLRFSDSTYMAYGMRNEHPGYVLLKSPIVVLDSAVLTDRFGSFEFADFTLDGNILFAGYKMTKFNNKSPYFVKTNDSLIKVLNPSTVKTSQEDFISNIQIIPNPITDCSKINFSLSKESLVSLKLYNPLGEELLSLPGQIYSSSEKNEIEICMTDFSIGLYYIVLESNGEFHTRQIVYLR